MKTKLLYSFLAIALIISSCGNDGDNDDQPDPCAVPITISFSANTNASNGQSDGSFTASATGGSGGYEYSIDGTNFQSSGIFSNLAAGRTMPPASSPALSDTEIATILAWVEGGAQNN